MKKFYRLEEEDLRRMIADRGCIFALHLVGDHCERYKHCDGCPLDYKESADGYADKVLKWLEVEEKEC